MKLLEPITIGNVHLKNRMIFPPMTTGYEENGAITDKSIRFYQRIAQGGASLIVLGDVSPVRTLSPIPMLFDDQMIPSFNKLTDAIHTHDCKVAAQIFHPEYNPSEIFALLHAGKMQEVRSKLHHDMEHFCNEISVEDIQRIQDLMVAAAIRADQAGFDMIQIHGDRLIGMFCSPIMNKRSDAYGGDIKSRSRFALEIVEKIRHALPHMAIDYKMAVIQLDPPLGKGGPTLEEAQWLAPKLVAMGVDSFHACQANHTSIGTTIPAMGTKPMGCFLPYAKGLKDVVTVPVSAVGRITKPDFAESILQDETADIIALGRQLIADPDWPKKVAESRPQDIRNCIMCNRGCTDKITGRSSMACAINGENGADFEINLSETTRPKQVLVIGGGPGGMEAARVISSRGHQVVLAEKEAQLGGQIHMAAAPPMKDEMIQIYDYLQGQLTHLDVDIRLNQQVTPQWINDIKPDVIVLATGSRPLLPPIPGMEKSHVQTAWDVLNQHPVEGQQVAVIGGGSVGVETAEYLAALGKQVRLIEMGDEIAADESASMKPHIQAFLDQHKVICQTKTALQTITSDAIVVKHGDQVSTYPADAVIIAVGSKTNTADQSRFSALASEFYVIGDCKESKARLLGDAIREGFQIGCSI